MSVRWSSGLGLFGSLSALASSDWPVLLLVSAPKLFPPSLLSAPQNSPFLLLVVSLRVSYQPTAMFPLFGSTARLGKNWLDPTGAWLTAIGVEFQLFAAPSFFEYFRTMSVSLGLLVGSGCSV